MFNIAALIANAKAIQTMFTLATGFAQTLDDAMPAGTPGKEKMVALTTFMKAEVAAVGVAEAQFDTLWPRAQALVEAFLTAAKAVKAATAGATSTPT